MPSPDELVEARDGRIAYIIPVFNEAKVIAETIAQVDADLVVCIDDGSTDTSADEIRKTSAVLLQHPFNLGQGAAIQTGIEYALQFPSVEFFVTFDADGQHSAEDARHMVEILKKGDVDIVVGSRFRGAAIDMPTKRRLLLRAAVVFTNLFSRVDLTDTHNGLRAFNRSFAEAVRLRIPGMGHASEIIHQLGDPRWRYLEIPITISYSEYSLAKGQSLMNSVNVFAELIVNRIKQ